MRFYPIPIYLFFSLTIRIFSRPAVIDKRRFPVRLFSAYSHFFSPPLCSVRL